ncbi:MAG TPA: DUF3488 domain-containing protein, partial [Candidatus Hydrogenedentes bacterium]|nr:DUF3488 domain-containing protein [Candidatus Hydrogenedentota bacterium]
MRNGTTIALRIASAVLVFSGYLALASTHEFGPAMLMIPLLFLPLAPLGEWLDGRYPVYRKITGVCSLMCFGLVLAAPSLNFRLLESVIALVVYIQVYTLVHRKTKQYYGYMYLMAFFLLLAASVLSPDAGMSVAMLLFLVGVTCAFALLEVNIELRALGYADRALLLPMHESTIRATTDSRGLFALGLVWVLATLCILNFLGTAAVFVFLPRFHAGFLGRQQFGPMITGLDRMVDLRSSGSV